jgi:hypothetical protein
MDLSEDALGQIVSALSHLNQHDLAGLAEAVTAEQQARAVANNDPQALVELGFKEGFDAKGATRTPWLVGGMLICPGVMSGPVGRTSHTCTFTRVGEHWCWEHPDVQADVVRQTSVGAQVSQRSITLIPAFEAMVLDVITSRYRTGAHHMTSGTSYLVQGTTLIKVNTRTPRAGTHGSR